MQASFHQWRNYRGLSWEANLTERDQLANTQKKNLKNGGESGCGWLY